MLMPDPSLKPPVDTGEKTISGRTIWNDPETGEDYSERSTTFEIEGKHYTMPTVSEDGRQHSEVQIRDYVIENGPIDYLTGEKLPVFESQDDAIDYAIQRSSTRKQTDMARGGMMNNQMRMFEEGGIADDGMDTDPVSGNEVPSGSLASEVRDDIPAQLSEGEYVVPADVVRFFGVRVFEEMRMEAKMGLQKMEQDGRIGGEPTMAQSAPPSNDSSITDEDLEQIEKMMTTGVADGGLMDKVAFIAANDPVINKSFNQGGAVVSFAVGGATQSAYNDPTKVDAVIGKFMQLVQSKPEIMDELAKRGIRVTRTGAEQKPQAMQQDNSASKTTEPVMAGKPAPAPAPVQADEGILALPKSESYITSPTMPAPAGFVQGYSVPGSSSTFQGPGVPKAIPTAPVAPAGGSGVPTTTGIVCPVGQVDNGMGVCVNEIIQGKNDDKIEPPAPPNYDKWMKTNGEIDFNDPEAFQKYIDDASKQSEFVTSGVGSAMSLIPSGVGAIIGIGVSAGQVNSYAELKVAELHAIASGNDKLLAIAQAGQKKFLAESGKFVNSKLGKFFAGKGAGALGARYASVLEGSGLDLGDAANWDKEQKKKYKDLTTAKKTKKVIPKVTAASASSVSNPKGLEGDPSKSIFKKSAAEREEIQKSTQQSIKTDKNYGKDPSKVGKSKKPAGAKNIKTKVQDGYGGDDKFGALNKGGLMKRNKIK